MSIFISKNIENIIDFLGWKLSKSWLFNVCKADFALVWFEITWGDSLQNLDSNFYCLLTVPISTSFFELFLKLTHCFLFFATSWYGFEANRLTRWINSEALGTKLFITTNNCYVHAERSHRCVLGILLQILPKSLSDHLYWSFVSKFHFVVSNLLS